MRSSITRRRLVGSGLAAWTAAGIGLASRAAAAPIPNIEKKRFNLGLPVPATSFLPVYIAAEKTWADEGIEVQIVSFRGDAEVSQALAGGSVDITVQSIDGLINLIEAKQPVVGFYAGFNQADFAWAAAPGLNSWADLRGKLVGVSTFGSLTDQLTRYVLRKNGLDPAKDVRILQSGPSAGRLQAVKAGRLSATILSSPFTWMAKEQGLSILGTQANDVSAEWPKHEMLTKADFLEKNPNTIKAFLRAHVSAIRIAKADRALAVGVLMKHLKYTKEHAELAYDEAIPGFEEHGRLPDRSMDVYWKIMAESGSVDRPWPHEKILDDRFISSFDTWAPPRNP